MMPAAQPVRVKETDAQQALRAAIVARLLGASSGQVSADWLAHILAAQRCGDGALPAGLGLPPETFTTLVAQHFPGCETWLLPAAAQPRTIPATLRGELREQLLDLRRDEWEDIRNLLLRGARDDSAGTAAFAGIIAAACLGSGHLWRDLGLPTRQALRDMFEYLFPPLASLNTKDMRWKKFLYRQQCESQGGFVCRSPSCEACNTYAECFGAEN